MNLDWKKPFGAISGETFVPDGCDTPAKYEQDGKFFDAHGKMILKAGTAIAAAPTDEVVVETDLPVMSVAELLAEAETMSWPKFKAAAQKALGPECPGSKAAIVEALKAAQREFDSRADRRRSVTVAGAKHETTVPSKHGVDLAAWGRGQREYLWGDVRKAIKAEFGRNVSERDDAVEFLVHQQVITANEARQDVLREAS